MSAKIMVIPEFHPHITVREMRPGQIGIATDQFVKDHILVLRTYDNLVDLNSPRRTWDLTVEFNIELLPEGTEVKIVAEEL